MNPAKNKQIEIIEFTDPVCTWCWGSEPVLRKLEIRYGVQVQISYIMGGLVKDITSFYDSYNDIGGDPDQSNRNIARHWAEASARHGMPVKTEGFNLFSREHPSTYPQNIAYKAAQMQDQALANKFLRRIREASAAESRQTNRTEVLLELASEVGLDIARFLEDYNKGAARKAFEEDLASTVRYGARGFPSFLMKYGDKEMVIHGYQRYEDFKALIGHLTGGEIQERPISADEETIMAFISRYGSAAPIEIQMTFDLTNAELESVVESLLTKKLIQKREAGSGYLISPSVSAAACDPATGVCAV